MTVPHFVFRSQQVQVQFDAPDNFVGEFQLAAARLDGELHLNHLASTPKQVHLQSPTQSTRVGVVAESAVIETTYFGEEFTSPTVPGARTSYALSKMDILLRLAHQCGARLGFLGVTLVAQASVAQGDKAALHRAAVDAFGLRGVLSECADPFDFSLRVSRNADDDTYSNVYVDWYQTRSAEIQIRAVPLGAIRPSSISPWEMSISDEGIQFRYDRNNKRGLFAGKRVWSVDEHLAIVRAANEGASAALDGVSRAITEASIGD